MPTEKKAVYQTKRIWPFKNAIKVTVPEDHNQDPIYGKSVRLYGSSKFIYSKHKNRYYLETQNIILLDGVKYE